MFYIIGLGLGDPKDITIKGLEIVKKCDRVYLESYTSILTCGKEALEEFYGRSIIIADRELVEQGIDEILLNANEIDIALLVVGDPFGATTHTDLILRCRENKINYQIVHNASIMNAIACCGLQLYNFGETVSIPYWTDSWKPDSFYDKINMNMKNGLHTLCLLDIRVKEPTLESLTKKRKEYEPPRFMSCAEASKQLIDILIRKRIESNIENTELAYTENNLCIGVARVGHDTQKIITCTLDEMCNKDLGPPLHSLVLPSNNMHPLERNYVLHYRE